MTQDHALQGLAHIFPERSQWTARKELPFLLGMVQRKPAALRLSTLQLLLTRIGVSTRGVSNHRWAEALGIVEAMPVPENTAREGLAMRSGAVTGELSDSLSKTIMLLLFHTGTPGATEVEWVARTLPKSRGTCS